MPADRLLTTLLRSLQSYSAQQDTPRLLSTASSILITLNNPKNLSLLTFQLLSSPAIWAYPDGTRTSLRFIGLYQSAALALVQSAKDEEEVRNGTKVLLNATQILPGGGLSWGDWIKAVVHGADERTPRWRHVLAIAGLILGFDQQGYDNHPRSLFDTLESAFIKALNLTLEDSRSLGEEEDGFGAQNVVLALNYCFAYLSHRARSRINYDRLLPVLLGSAYFSIEGFRSGYFLGLLDPDIISVQGERFSWPEYTHSFQQLSDMASRPLVASMGPLSRLIAHTIENVSQSWLAHVALEDLAAFAKTICNQWRRSRMSEIDSTEVPPLLDEATLSRTRPQLWQILRSILFSVVIILRAGVGRAVSDGSLQGHQEATSLATQTLRTLRDLSFVSTRINMGSFAQYEFVFLTAVDILSTSPSDSESFLQESALSAMNGVPEHVHDQVLTLFLLNTAEHFSLSLSPAANESLLLACATPHLDKANHEKIQDTKLSNELFEAAHSVTLSVFSAPQNADIASRHLPFYVDKLFDAFSRDQVSSRQMRLACKTLLRITNPPSPLSSVQPGMGETLLEVLRDRAVQSPPERLNQSSLDISPRAILTLALVDSLPTFPVILLAEWLHLTAKLVHLVDVPQERLQCQDRFWEVLSSGEMDPERSAVCVAWWGTHGGRAMVFDSQKYASAEDYVEDEALMSGALQPAGSKSKL
ncbi:MAG: hypothetical protein M1831_002181 [Alyxoria varia]|nr:MAG: hypothetical protein M1831_002181 [Alyxoria varia]